MLFEKVSCSTSNSERGVLTIPSGTMMERDSESVSWEVSCTFIPKGSRGDSRPVRCKGVGQALYHLGQELSLHEFHK